MMDIKRIKIIGLWDQNEEMHKGLNRMKAPKVEDHIITAILNEKYQLVDTEEPDYVITSEKGAFPYMQYDGIRILFTREHFAPDFNVFDYAIGPDPIICLDDDGEDRYFQLPDSGADFETYKTPEEMNSVREELKTFLFHIFDQDVQSAYRRLRFYNAKSHQKCLNEYRQLRQSVLYPIVRSML